MAGINKDIFANRFAVQVIAINDGEPAFTEVPTYTSAFSKEAFILHRIEYHFKYSDLDLVVAADDEINAGITTSNKVTAIDSNSMDEKDPCLIDVVRITAALRGAAANMSFIHGPIISDFTSLPGGGIIVPSRPLFGCAEGKNIVANVTCRIRGYFTRIELKADEFLELVDAYRMIA